MKISEINKKTPNYYLRLHSINVFDFSDTFVFQKSENRMLWIILSGSGSYRLSSSDEDKKYKKHSLISKPCADEWIFTSVNSQTSVFCAEYKLYVSSTDIGENPQDGFQMNYHTVDFDFDYDTKNVSGFLPDAVGYIQAMLTIFNTEKAREVILAKRIEYFLSALIEYERINNDMVFRSLSAVAISCLKPSDHPEFKLDIGNIAIKTGHQEKKPSTAVTFYVNHKYVELPKLPDNYLYEYYPDTQGGTFCSFSMKTDSSFKIWFFSGPSVSGRSIADILNDGYISFSARSNVTCRLQLGLYSIPSYNSVNYYFDIAKANEWVKIRIPLLANQKSATKSPYVMQALAYIQDNFREKITVDEIAKQILINPTYLSGLFHKEVGQPITSYINFCRINLAKQLLFESDQTITSIAAYVGFYDSSHFLKAFKKMVGISPKEYRRIKGTK